MNRRRFLHQGMAVATGCACATLGGCTTLNPNAKPITAAAADDGRMPLGKAAALGVGDQLKVTVPGVADPVLVARVSETEVKAISIACSHFGSEIELALAESQFRCTNHGSLFDYQGKVLEGPASDPLPTYPVVEEGGELFLVVSGG